MFFFLIPVTPSKVLYDLLLFLVLYRQEAGEHFPGVLQSKVWADQGVSRSRSTCSSTFGCLDKSTVLQVSAGLG